MKLSSYATIQQSIRRSLSIIVLASVATLSFLAATSSAQAAEYRYVSDVMLINMRSGPTNAYRIIKRIKSGTELTVLKHSDDNTFTQVRLNDGTTGWAPSQYLMKEKGTRERLKEAQKQIAMLSQDAGPMLKKMKATETKNQELQAKNLQLTSENKQISAEIKAIKIASANAIGLSNSNKTLGESNQMLKNEIDVLTADNERLKDKSDLEWFINGAGTVGFGVLLALIIPRLIPKKRRSDWN
ncbi:SH3 domain protein [Sinobacterium caligoides]|uniref:SH3 domain protein n=1 Tax=Sinobacterium caligoides TaxID=933926 RepID=A0A3N2DY10_9GAMM|nr:TIGR04211 family SH3 domain-containing protein [Sinobacterium caligoides]ROS04756.1 SH3 domain protein [Sinobacterium caligoides]